MVAMVVSVLLSGRDHRSLDGGPWPGERSARSRQARSTAKEGARRVICVPRGMPPFAAGEINRRSPCGKAIEARPSLGLDPSIRGCVRCAPIKQIDGDHHDYCHRRRTRTWQHRSRKDFPRSTESESAACKRRGMNSHCCAFIRAHRQRSAECGVQARGQGRLDAPATNYPCR